MQCNLNGMGLTMEGEGREQGACLFIELCELLCRVLCHAHDDVLHSTLEVRIVNFDLNVPCGGLLRRRDCGVERVVQDYRLGRREIAVDDLGQLLKVHLLSAENLGNQYRFAIHYINAMHI